MRKKFIFGYSLILLFAFTISILVLSFKNFEVTISRVIGELYIFLSFIKIPFFPFLNVGYQTLLYLFSPYLILIFLPKGLSRKQVSALRLLGHTLKYKDEQNHWLVKDAKIKIKKEFLELKTPNLNITLDEVLKDKERYESIFGKKFARILKEDNSNSLSFKFYFDLFKQIDSSKVVSPELFNLPLGYSNEGKLIRANLKTDFSFGLYARSGAGKTVYLKNLIQLLGQQNNQMKKIVFDSKLADWSQSYCDQNNVELIEMNTVEQVQNGIDILKGILDKRSEISKLLREFDLTHSFELMERGILPLSEETVLIFDEYHSYTNKVADKELSKKFEEFASLLNLGLSQLRFTGVTLILATQRLNADASLVNRDNILTMLFNGINEEMSRKFANGEGQKLERGKWYLCSDSMPNEYIKSIHFNK